MPLIKDDGTLKTCLDMLSTSESRCKVSFSWEDIQNSVIPIDTQKTINLLLHKRYMVESASGSFLSQDVFAWTKQSTNLDLHNFLAGFKSIVDNVEITDYDCTLNHPDFLVVYMNNFLNKSEVSAEERKKRAQSELLPRMCLASFAIRLCRMLQCNDPKELIVVPYTRDVIVATK